MRRVQVSLVREPGATPRKVSSGNDVAELFFERFGDSHVEHFAAIYLDNKHHVIGWYPASKGTPTSSVVHPRDIFTPAVHLSAVAVIVAHNHPSGDPLPSRDDQLVTKRLRDAGELLGIEVLDHVILGSTHFYAFSEETVFPYQLPKEG